MSTPKDRAFAQVDVFSSVPLLGNPVAVVIDGEGIDDETMAAFARWTNLSETTFVLPPTDPAADYRLRIFTPGGELPFAGHPTLGSAHAWLENGGKQKDPAFVVQECEVGLVRLRRYGSQLAFAAPPRIRTGALDGDTLALLVADLGLQPGDVAGHAWVDNGAGWAALLLGSSDAVLALEPQFRSGHTPMVGVVGATPPGSDTQFEVRAFAVGVGVTEDPVTGSLNAGLAQWLIETGVAPETYVASQGARVGRAGRVSIDSVDGDIWVGGDSVSLIRGTIRL